MHLPVLESLPDPRPLVLEALARAFAPAPRLSVSEWAERNRYISEESGSRYPGRWRNERMPHLVEIMDALSPSDPCQDVTVVGSAQCGKSSVGENWMGYIVDADPGPMAIVLPSTAEASKYVKVKLQPTIDATPALRAKVLDYTSRSEAGSTTSYKKFPRGYIQVTYAGSSKGLQMISARYTLAEEVSEWPAEAGLRGDPVAQLENRTTIYERDRKRLWVSTPSMVGHCRISQRYDASDRRRRYLPCPSCGAWQTLEFPRLKWDSDRWPHGAWFECAANGCVIDHLDKAAMLAAGTWIATRPNEDGTEPPGHFPATDLARWRDRRVPTRQKGFHVWMAYNPMVSWDDIVARWLSCGDEPGRIKDFTQQVLGEAYEEQGDAPDAEALLARRVVPLRRGVLPQGPLFLTGAVDVQGKRLEWGVWGWSEGKTRWLIDWGIVEGDPEDDTTWARLDREVITRRWTSETGLDLGCENWGIDSGYASHAVYNFTRRRLGLMALDGQEGRTHPFIGTPRKRDVNWKGQTIKGGVMLWPVGGHPLKSDLYGAIRKTIAGPDENGAWQSGAMILPGDIDRAYCDQLTAETLVAVERQSGLVDYRWRKLFGRPNEALDIACYARAVASHIGLDVMTEDAWARLRAERGAPPAPPQGDLFAVAVAAPPDLPAAGGPAPARRYRSRGRRR